MSAYGGEVSATADGLGYNRVNNNPAGSFVVALYSTRYSTRPGALTPGDGTDVAPQASSSYPSRIWHSQTSRTTETLSEADPAVDSMGHCATGSQFALTARRGLTVARVLREARNAIRAAARYGMGVIDPTRRGRGECRTRGIRLAVAPD
jgi:hypothetical protein